MNPRTAPGFLPSPAADGSPTQRGALIRNATSTIRRGAYTLIEVLVAASLIGVAMTAAVSMSSTMMLQEELSWRVAIAMNYQENACRVWQLGLAPDKVAELMPDTKGHIFLNEILDSAAVTTPLATANQGGFGVMDSASNALQVANYANGPAGSITTIKLFRPTTRGNASEP